MYVTIIKSLGIRITLNNTSGIKNNLIVMGLYLNYVFSDSKRFNDYFKRFLPVKLVQSYNY